MLLGLVGSEMCIRDINKGKITKVWSNVRVKDHAKEVLNFIKSSK